MDENEFCNSIYGEIQGRGVCGGYVAFSHRALEKNLGFIPPDAKILEVGGNLGEHSKFVTHEYESYLITDKRFVDAKPKNNLIRFEVANVENLPFPDSSFDRVLSTCLLHHLDDPERGLREMRRVVKAGGLISLTLPCDPGVLYRLGKTIGPYRAMRKRFKNLSPKYSHYVQHRNHFSGLETKIDHVFQNDQVKSRNYPFVAPFWNINLFRIYQIRKT